MKKSISRTAAFSRTELLIVIAILGLLGLLFVRAQEDPEAKERQQRMECVRNVKIIGLAFRMWANDNSELFPMQVVTARGGSKEAIASGESFRHFIALSNYLPEVKHLTCPSDERTVASTFSTVRNTNMSYFVGLDADETRPQMLLSGDRNLTNGLPLKNGVMTLAPEFPEGWTAAIHNERGNLGLADGSAQQVSTVGLRRQIQAQAHQSPKPEAKQLQFPE